MTIFENLSKPEVWYEKDDCTMIFVDNKVSIEMYADYSGTTYHSLDLETLRDLIAQYDKIKK